MTPHVDFDVAIIGAGPGGYAAALYGALAGLRIAVVEQDKVLIAAHNADGSAGAIPGVHLLGPWASEQLGQGHLAVNIEAAQDQIAKFIQPHPTLSESFGETVLALTGRRIHMGSILLTGTASSLINGSKCRSDGIRKDV